MGKSINERFNFWEFFALVLMIAHWATLEMRTGGDGCNRGTSPGAGSNRSVLSCCPAARSSSTLSRDDEQHQISCGQRQ